MLDSFSEAEITNTESWLIFFSHSQLRTTVLVIDIVKDGGPLTVISRGDNI